MGRKLLISESRVICSRGMSKLKLLSNDISIVNFLKIAILSLYAMRSIVSDERIVNSFK